VIERHFSSRALFRTLGRNMNGNMSRGRLRSGCGRNRGGPPRISCPERPGNRSHVMCQAMVSVRKCSLTFGSHSSP
jgi:hypothetical protein